MEVQKYKRRFYVVSVVFFLYIVWLIVVSCLSFPGVRFYLWPEMSSHFTGQEIRLSIDASQDE